MKGLVDHFRRDEQSRHSEWLRQQKWFIKARQDKQVQQQIADRLDDAVGSFASSVVMATDVEIADFEIKLDSYDEAVVIALLENQEALDEVEARIADMLDRAYVFEGRRVFLTEDGEQVFDEFGVEVFRDELDFGLISPDKPTWEAFKADNDLYQTLKDERSQILEFQSELDEARDAVSEGEISKADLEELDAALAAKMPPAVARHTPGYEPPATPLALKSEFSSPAKPAAEGRLGFSEPQAPQPGQ